jgi:hypothetical protein
MHSDGSENCCGHQRTHSLCHFPGSSMAQEHAGNGGKTMFDAVGNEI